MSKKSLKKALLDAAFWLETHPDKHITTKLATNARGQTVPPSSKGAICFCAAGRLAMEYGVPVSDPDDEAFNAMLDKIGVQYEDIYNRNDLNLDMFGFKSSDQREAMRWPVHPFCASETLSGPEVIKYLRELAAKMPDDDA